MDPFGQSHEDDRSGLGSASAVVSGLSGRSHTCAVTRIVPQRLDVPAPPFRPPIAFAHRGASAYAPGNTLEAFRLARAQGATGLESDAWLAADGVVVLVHDRTIRLPGQRIDVTRTTSTALAELHVPTLAALYADLEAGGGDLALSLDLEHPAVALPAIEVAERAGAAARLWACHDDLGLLAALRVRSTAVRLVCSTRPRRVAGGVPALIDRLAVLALDALNMHWRDWSLSLVEHCHRVGLAAFGWDAQERMAMDRLLGIGIDALYGDAPDRLIAAVTEHAAR
jgi:glycerophosphoryl diester phosphodiesterase